MIPATIDWDIRLRRIAPRVVRNMPKHRDPEAIFIEASEIESELMAIAREIEQAKGRAAA